MVQALDLEVAIKGDPKKNWFSVLLFRLMFKSDKVDYALLKSVYPIHAFMWEYWRDTEIIPDPEDEEFKKWIVDNNEEKIIELLKEHGK